MHLQRGLAAQVFGSDGEDGIAHSNACNDTVRRAVGIIAGLCHLDYPAVADTPHDILCGGVQRGDDGVYHKRIAIRERNGISGDCNALDMDQRI